MDDGRTATLVRRQDDMRLDLSREVGLKSHFDKDLLIAEHGHGFGYSAVNAARNALMASRFEYPMYRIRKR